MQSRGKKRVHKHKRREWYSRSSNDMQDVNVDKEHEEKNLPRSIRRYVISLGINV